MNDRYQEGRSARRKEWDEERPTNAAHSPKHKKHRSRLTRQQKILVGVCVALTVVLGLVIAYKALFVKPDLPGILGNSSEVTEDGMAPKVSGERKSDDYYTILLLGRDTGGGGNCDTMMLVSYDVTNQNLNVMSIPRDTMVNVPWDVKKINSVYNYYGGDEKGIKALDGEISDLLGFVPDYSVIVEWEAVGKLVDAIGGVEFDVPLDMNYEDPYQDLSIHVNKGLQTLNGEQAMGVIRWRHNNSGGGYASGDLGRIETQQAFLKAVIKQLLQVKNVSKIQKFSKIFEENVTTDLSVQNLFWFGKSAIIGGLSMDNVNFVTMPNKTASCWSRTYHNYQSYVVPDPDAMLELVNTALSPFVEKVTLSQLDLMSVNSDGSISSTTGHVEDSKATKAPSIPAHTDTTPVDNEGTGEADPNTENPPTEDVPSGGETGGSTSENPGGNPGTGEETGGDSGTSGGETTTPGTSGGETGEGTTGEEGYGEITTPAEPTEPTVTGNAT